MGPEIIFLDASFLLGGLVRRVMPQDETMAGDPSLLEPTQLGEVDVTGSDSMLSEIAFVLNPRRRYDLAPAQVAARLESILLLPEPRLLQKKGPCTAPSRSGRPYPGSGSSTP